MPRHYEDTETRRRQVAEAALKTVVEDGVARFRTRAVAARVGISEGTLFRHFGNKEEIVREAMNLLETEIDAGLVETEHAKADLEAFFRHRAAFVGAQASVGRLIFSNELAHLAGEAGPAQVARWRQKSLHFVQGRLGILAAAGELHPALDMPAMCMLIQGALLTFAMHASLAHKEPDGDLPARISHAWRALTTVLFKG